MRNEAAFGSSVFISFFIIFLAGIIYIGAQQSYQEADFLGYSCTSNATTCQAFTAYRALEGDNLRSLGNRFERSADQVAQASGIPPTSNLTSGQLLLIPINCSCASGRSQYNVSYIIEKGDTFYLVSNNTFQGLTTYQAVERSNPSFDPLKLEPGDRIIFPIRCACPSAEQQASGVKSLVTYSILPDENVQKISSDWNVTQESLLSANRITGSSAPDLQAFTTLLLPITQDTPELPQTSSTPATPISPSPSSTESPDQTDGGGGGDGDSSSKTGTYVGIAAGCTAAAVIVALLALFFLRRRSRKLSKSSKRDHHQSAASYATTEKQDQYGSLRDSSGYLTSKERQDESFLPGMNDLMDSEKPVMFTYAELQEATNSFSSSHLIQGSVYRAVLRKQLVAIKEMKGGTTSQELKILCKVHHSNLVKLIGICSGTDHLFLVYEYAENGSLSSCLHNKTPVDLKLAENNNQAGSASTSSAFLSWNTRLQIALDVATGLEYVHDYTKPSFVHKDVKSSNILLDAGFRAKIANFGMARLANDAALTKHITGTQGYMSPEYLTHGFVTTKVDVFAFGVVLLELLTGREAILSDRRYLAEVFVDLVDGMSEDAIEAKIEKLKIWLDPVLENAVPWEVGVMIFVEIARSCVDNDPDSRPNMKDVTYRLSKLLDSCLEWETTAVLSRRYNTAALEGR